MSSSGPVAVGRTAVATGRIAGAYDGTRWRVAGELALAVGTLLALAPADAPPTLGLGGGSTAAGGSESTAVGSGSLVGIGDAAGGAALTATLGGGEAPGCRRASNATAAIPTDTARPAHKAP